MLAVNFEDVASTAGISIQDLGFTIASGMTGGAGSATADMIQVYNAVNGTYTDYFLYNNPRQATNPKNGKWVTTENGFPVAEKSFKSGDSFWVCLRGDNDVIISISGSVSLESKQDISIVKGYNMIGSAFPASFNPNSLGQDYWKEAIAAGAVGGTGTATADMIQVYDAATGKYTDYFLYNNARQASNAKNGKWVTTETGFPAISDTAEVLPVGKGAWYCHRGEGFTLKVNSPIK